MSPSPEEVRALLAAVEASEWDEVSIVVDGLTLQMSRTSPHPSWASDGERPAPPVAAAAAPTAPVTRAASDAPPKPSAAPPQEEAPAAARAGEHSSTDPATLLVVDSPSLGLVWRSPKPGAPPFVAVGDVVAAGDTLCIVEVMKLMHQVSATADGQVVEVHVENGQMVEFAQPLVTLAAG